MTNFLSNLRQILRNSHNRSMNSLCSQLLSQRGEACQTALAQEIINTYKAMNSVERLGFFEMLCREFSQDEAAVLRAAADYGRKPGTKTLEALAASVESPRQELIRRINTAPGGTEALVLLREHLLDASDHSKNLDALDVDLRHLFRSWFNRGFLRLERISWQTSARILEKLIRYDSVHEITDWLDLRRRLDADRRCFAFFHPALNDEPLIFVEVALSNGLTRELEPILDVKAPILPLEMADTAMFYSINNCLKGLRNIPFGNFLIKQVVAELAVEFPKIKTYCTLSPLPGFAHALRDSQNEQGFTPDRLSRLLADYAWDLALAAKRRSSVDAFFYLLEQPLAYPDVLAGPLRRVALAYVTKARKDGKLYDPVAAFHLSNGARLEWINPAGNLRPYGLKASFGVTVNYRYVPAELEDNHERFVRGQIQVSSSLLGEQKKMEEAWYGRKLKVVENSTFRFSDTADLNGHSQSL